MVFLKRDKQFFVWLCLVWRVWKWWRDRDEGKEEKVILKNDLKISESKVKLNLYVGNKIENSKYQEVEQIQTDYQLDSTAFLFCNSFIEIIHVP